MRVPPIVKPILPYFKTFFTIILLKPIEIYKKIIYNYNVCGNDNYICIQP